MQNIASKIGDIEQETEEHKYAHLLTNSQSDFCFQSPGPGSWSKSTPVLTLLRLVLETLEPLPGDRKCFRMINGVLAERTVADIVPILQTNQDGLKKTLEELVKQYKTRQDEMEKWKVCGVVMCEKNMLTFIAEEE